MPEPAVSLGAVIVAAGSGTRMDGLDKLFAPLRGRPVLARTVAAFQECAAVQRTVVVLSSANLDRGRRLVDEHGLDKVHRVCAGGPRRQDSVRLGLEALGPCHWVAVHDGARPLLTPDLILRALEAARDGGAAVPALPLADTIKESGPDGVVVRTLDRRRIWAVQTPQLFRRDLLLRAHREVTDDATDDAAMLEALGLPVRLIQGSRLNLKITTPEDLALAQAILAAAEAPAPSDLPCA
jgi:2-C-methyl-D-erythritol 4-phosphate cytidylyltransferase